MKVHRFFYGNYLGSAEKLWKICQLGDSEYIWWHISKERWNYSEKSMHLCLDMLVQNS